jgi:DoxX
MKLNLSTFRLGSFNDRINSALIGLTRIVVGVLWLANLEWKRPTSFGQARGNGLYKYVNAAVDPKTEVFAPYSWLVRHVVIPNYSAFGWMTLLLESTLAVLLILGLWTRPAALLGAGLSVSILLSVLYYPNEWPWAYFLMIAAHLLVFATDAGAHLGFDGLIRSGNRMRAQIPLALFGVLIGFGGLFVSRNKAFSATQGALLGVARWEIKTFWFNRLSSILTLALAFALIAGIAAQQKILLWIAAGGFTLMALQVLVQWRELPRNLEDPGAPSWTGGVLGSTGATFAFWALMAIGIYASTRNSPNPTADKIVEEKIGNEIVTEEPSAFEAK